MLKTLKLGTLHAARRLGVFSGFKVSQWRNKRLLILCYHGLSFDDEHVWNPALYLAVPTFRRRMTAIRDGGYTVLPLDEALRRLADGTLPPRSVALTFDDGEYNFYALAWPVLREFGFPATVYLATYYCRHQIPVFDVTAAYTIWKGRGRNLDLGRILPGEDEILISNENARPLFQRLHRSVSERRLSAGEKEELAEDLATRLGQDYDDTRRRRIFHLVTAEETAELSKGNISIELHTHRHRTPRDRGQFVREIDDNRKEIREITGREPSHFCYPCGDYAPEFFGWLREAGVRSATTCEPGLASVSDNWMRLPRLLDMNSFSAIEFEGWLAGMCAGLPSR